MPSSCFFSAHKTFVIATSVSVSRTAFIVSTCNQVRDGSTVFRMKHLKQRPTVRREPVEDKFNKYVADLIGDNDMKGDSVLDSRPSPAPSPLAEVVGVSIIPTFVESAPGFNFPTSSQSGSGVRGTSSTRISSQHIPTFGWIMIISSATLAIIAVLMGMNILFTSYSHKRHYVDADEIERLDEKELSAEIPGMIVISHRAPSKAYGRLEDEEDPSNNSRLTDNVPIVHFRARQQQRGFERLESERLQPSHLTTIPEERSLGDLGTLCDEEYIFEDHTE